MSQQNVELTYQALDAFNRRDLGEYLATTDPEIEFTPYEVRVQGGEPYRGFVGVRRWWEESFAVFPDLRNETYEVRDFGERTLAHGHLRAQGAGSGASIERPMWLVIEWRDKKAVWWSSYESEGDAPKLWGSRSKTRRPAAEPLFLPPALAGAVDRRSRRKTLRAFADAPGTHGP